MFLNLFNFDNEIRDLLSSFPEESYYITSNGSYIKDHSIIPDNQLITLHFRLRGGKGGFGSLLRAIGSQIKTTDKQSCRFN